MPEIERARFVAFFDESQREGFLCVAGLVCDVEQAFQLDEAWRQGISEPFEALTGEPFHMRRLGYLRSKHGSAVIDDYERNAINLIDRHVAYAIGVLFALDVVKTVVMGPEWRERFRSIYGACCQLAMLLCGQWTDQRGYDGLFAYCFESGHADQGNASDSMLAIRDDDFARSACRYGTHNFLNKRENMPLQAADVWAWLVTRYYVEREKGLKANPSIRRLIDGPDGDKYDLRVYPSEESVRRFFDETFGKPWKNAKTKRAYEKRIENLKRRGERKVPG